MKRILITGVAGFDHLADKKELQHHYKLNLNEISSDYDLIVLAESHKKSLFNLT